MREIKFRGRWNKKWVYGGIDICRNGEVFIGGNGIWCVACKDTVGQFTGLYDKNGKEIYEGDIIEQVFCGKAEIGPVTIEPTRGVMVGNYPFWAHNAEVIGNIHEHAPRTSSFPQR